MIFVHRIGFMTAKVLQMRVACLQRDEMQLWVVFLSYTHETWVPTHLPPLRRRIFHHLICPIFMIRVIKLKLCRLKLSQAVGSRVARFFRILQHTKMGKMYENNKIYQMAIKYVHYIKCTYFFHSKIYPKYTQIWIFLYENIRSGNPVRECLPRLGEHFHHTF
jgi:hypothetical protein